MSVPPHQLTYGGDPNTRTCGGVGGVGDDGIFALGGHNGLSIFESVERMDLGRGEWREALPMLSKRCRLGVAALGGRIYACGGYDGSLFLKSVECFDPRENK